MEEELAMLRRELASTRAAAALMVRLMEIKAELEDMCRSAEDPGVRAALGVVAPAADFDVLAADAGERVRGMLHTTVHAIHAARAPPSRARCNTPKCRCTPTPKCKHGMCAKCCGGAHDQAVCRFQPTAGKRPRVAPPAGDP